MFEAYTRNKYNSTGVIQWMLNNAWPFIFFYKIKKEEKKFVIY